MEKLLNAIIGFLIANKAIVLSVLAGFILAMYMFADSYQIEQIGKDVFAIGYGLVGVALFGVGLNTGREAYLGIDDASTARGDNPGSASNRLAGFFLALVWILIGAGMAIGAVIHLIG